MTFNIDWKFIAGLEGADRLTGYVPLDAAGAVLGQSGVTVSTGFDVGQHSAIQIDDFFGKTDPALAALLKPYAGLKRTQAVAALAKTPLTITQAQSTLIYTTVKTRAANQIAASYDAAVAAKADPKLVRFRALAREAQTVIASVAFQYGADLKKAAPKFFRAAVAQDWATVETELRNFGDGYRTRRGKEADYLTPLVPKRTAKAKTP
ncbi:pesticin C-terminus-like muramidase [Jannaschia sp. LMIT008]|uniref:pesticin C-terminus-like muramidase n=1 Tax=Jannaschia maritima TaxID=3032585 RepID=UPI002811EA1B|nr:pesticin C-terminus-like muramidase [Jannaschia sp. LMIT008]